MPCSSTGESKLPAQHQRPIVVLAHFSVNNRFRDDLFPLIDEYRRFADVIVVSSASGLRWHPERCIGCASAVPCDRDPAQPGYDFGSWKTALNLHRQDVEQSAFLCSPTTASGDRSLPSTICSNACTPTADVIGLTDNLMYEPHLSSAFIAYKPKALQCPAFDRRWESLQIWPRKRDLVKQCEVGLPVQLRQQDRSSRAFTPTTPMAMFCTTTGST